MKENIKRLLEETGAAKRLIKKMNKNFGIEIKEETLSVKGKERKGVSEVIERHGDQEKAENDNRAK